MQCLRVDCEKTKFVVSVRNLEGKLSVRINYLRARFFFVPRLLGVVHALGGFQKKTKKNRLSTRGCTFFGTTEHESHATHARNTD